MPELPRATLTSRGPTAYAADRVFDGERVLPDHAVVVREGVVAQVVPRRALPSDVPLLREPNATILPGLIDTHAHYMSWQGPVFLAYGVTTIRDIGNGLQWILARRAQSSEELSPRLLCVGPLLDGPQPLHPFVARACANLDDAVNAVRDLVAAGVDGIKLYVGLPGDWLAPMVAEAHTAGLKASMHCAGTGVLAAGSVGVDEFFHLDGLLADIWPDHPPGWLSLWGLPAFDNTLPAQHRAADAIHELGMTATPTLAYWQSQWRIRAADYDPGTDAPHVPADMVAWQGTVPHDAGVAAQWRRAVQAAQRFMGALIERDVPVLAGSDVPCGALTPGLSLWREMRLLQESGMPPIRALRAATSDAAAFLGKPDLGRLGKGSVADLVIVKGDPTAAIPARPEVVAVVHRGTLHRPADLLEQVPDNVGDAADDPWAAQFRAHAEAAGAIPAPGSD